MKPLSKKNIHQSLDDIKKMIDSLFKKVYKTRILLYKEMLKIRKEIGGDLPL